MFERHSPDNEKAGTVYKADLTRSSNCSCIAFIDFSVQHSLFWPQIQCSFDVHVRVRTVPIFPARMVHVFSNNDWSLLVAGDDSVPLRVCLNFL